MANLTKSMRRRAQHIANQTGQPRWINYTSLGWKTEKRPSGPENLRIRIDPQPEVTSGQPKRI